MGVSQERLVLISILAVCAVTFLATLFGPWVGGRLPYAKLLNSLSVLLGLASIVQLKIAGWFDFVLKEYGDDEKYPYGPPSHITRQIIDDPDHPVRTAIRNYLFFDASFGANLAVAGLVVALVATWIG